MITVIVCAATGEDDEGEGEQKATARSHAEQDADTGDVSGKSIMQTGERQMHALCPWSVMA